MKKMLVLLAVLLAGCNLSVVLNVPEPVAPEPVGVEIAVGGGGSIYRILHYAESDVSFKAATYRNLKVTHDLVVDGELNKGMLAQIKNASAAVGQIQSTGFLGELHVRGTLYNRMGEQWVGPIANPFAGAAIYSIAYGNGVFVVVGNVGQIARSTDYGATWGALIGNPFGAVTIHSVEYGNGVFVAVANSGEIARSTDYGATWGALIGNPFGANNIYSLSYGNGVFVAAGEAGTMARSTDYGVTWGALIGNPFGASAIYSIAYGNGVFISVGNAGKIARSTDYGVNWGALIANPFGATDINRIAYGNEVFTAVGNAGKIARSAYDYGVTWGALLTTPFGATDIFSVNWNYGIFQAGTFAGTIARSYDNGLNWGSLITNPFGTNTIFCIASSDTNLCAVGLAGSIATAGWNAAYSLQEPVPGEPSQGTSHITSDATRSASAVVDTTTNTAGVWSAAVTMPGVPVGAKAAYCSTQVALAGQRPILCVEAATGYTLSDITAGTNYAKYFNNHAPAVGASQVLVIKIHLDSNGQFRWCTTNTNSSVWIGCPIDYDC
jgi:hypothetical protein